jgi:hypothetical protein
MNKKIRELAEQSGFFPVPDETEVDWEYRAENARYERFAELIIQECIKVIDPNTCERAFANQSNEEFWKNQSIYLIVKHFGMKENK